MDMFSLIRLAAFGMLTHTWAYGQQNPLNDCSNLGVETGSFNAWQGIAGKWYEDTAANKIIIETEETGLNEQRHFIRRITDGFIPEIRQEQIPYVPEGSQFAIQLGNSRIGREYERLTTSFEVDSFNALFQYRFAVVFEDPGHLPIQQPKFELTVSDNSGATIPCGFYQVTAGSDLDGFKTEGNIRYRNWTTASVDLRNYIGQVVTLRISTYDCSEGGHWGYALFDASCLAAQINAINYCPGADTSITLEAPLGFRNYLWSNGATTPTTTFRNPKPGQTLEVEFVPFSSLSDACKLNLKYVVPTKVVLTTPNRVSFCEGGEVEVRPVYPGTGPYTIRWTPGGDTTRNKIVRAPGLYVVAATKGHCTLRDTVTATQTPAPKITLTHSDPYCRGLNDGWIKSEVSGVAPFRYKWSNRDTATNISGLSPGPYVVTVTESKTGCSATKSRYLVQSDSVLAFAKLVSMPLCDNRPVGEATASASGGKPPYTYRWSTGSTLPSTQIKSAGVFWVSVTDTQGCMHADSVPAAVITANIQSKGNVCPEGKQGEIVLSASGGKAPYLYKLENGDFGPNAQFGGLATGAYLAQVKDQTGCIKSFNTVVSNLRAEPLKVQISTDTSVIIGDYVEISASTNYPIRAIHWDSPCLETASNTSSVRFLPLDRCIVTVEVTDEQGCKAISETLIDVLKDYGKYIPNVFMPHSGGANSKFYFSAKMHQIRSINSFRVFDRWGNLMFEDFDYMPNDSEQGWDGVTEGKLAPPGVYVYQIEIEFIDGVRKVFAGDVTLIR
jgi:gliding motility-associated-like protein